MAAILPRVRQVKSIEHVKDYLPRWRIASETPAYHFDYIINHHNPSLSARMLRSHFTMYTDTPYCYDMVFLSSELPNTSGGTHTSVGWHIVRKFIMCRAEHKCRVAHCLKINISAG